jgi:hypothetical protein
MLMMGSAKAETTSGGDDTCTSDPLAPGSEPDAQCRPAFGPAQMAALQSGAWTEARRNGYTGCECPDDTVNIWRPLSCYLYSDGSQLECSIGYGGNLLTTCTIFFNDMSVVQCTTVRMR